MKTNLYNPRLRIEAMRAGHRAKEVENSAESTMLQIKYSNDQDFWNAFHREPEQSFGSRIREILGKSSDWK